MCKRFIIILALLVLLSGQFAIAERKTVYVLADESSVLNVRELPRIGAEKVFEMERGETLTMDSLDKYGWACVSRAGDFGYCRVEYLTDKPPEEATVYQTTVGKLKVRDVPGGDTVRKLKNGATVMVTGWITDIDGTQWAHVEGGYVMARYLEAAGLQVATEETQN